MLQAVHGHSLMQPDEASNSDDVRVLRRALVAIRGGDSPPAPLGKGGEETPPSPRLERGEEREGDREAIPIELHDSGTALRFLSAYAASLPGKVCTLTGSERLKERPVRPLLEILEKLGAKITYLEREGFLPFRIEGCALRVPEEPITVPTEQSTQFASALLLIGLPVRTRIEAQNIETTQSESPYIEMTRALVRAYETEGEAGLLRYLEPDWSAAAFWMEYVALHGGEIVLAGLHSDSLQGDKRALELFRPLGVEAKETEQGMVLSRRTGDLPAAVAWDFSHCPDLYPAAAVTCHQLGVRLEATGLAALAHKESDRIASVKQMLATGGMYCVRSEGDHRIAMAAMAAGWQTDKPECADKSYPTFREHYYAVTGTDPVQPAVKLPVYEAGQPLPALIVPRKGINDEGKGKKHALYRLVSQATSPFVLFRDNDVLPPEAVPETDADMMILTLRMDGGDSLIERLQRAEYAAIQEVTVRTAKRGKAVMCSGANLQVRRERWLESWPELCPEIPSGDDMFLLQSFRRRGLKIAVADDPRYEAVVHPVKSWKGLLRQRMRWAGKAPRYRDRLILRYGAMVLTANLLQLLCPLVILVKFPIEWGLIKKRDRSVSLVDALLLELIYPFYVLVSLLGGLIRKRW